MLKVIATIVRRAHISHEELVTVWEEVHAPHVVKLAQPLLISRGHEVRIV